MRLPEILLNTDRKKVPQMPLAGSRKNKKAPGPARKTTLKEKKFELQINL